MQSFIWKKASCSGKKFGKQLGGGASDPEKKFAKEMEVYYEFS